MKKQIFSLLLSCLLINNVFNQEEEILLSIGDNKISKSEFERIYHKNNSSAAYDNKSVEEYIELFINFKLKVIEAEALGYDTVKMFIDELAGYREQLARPYMEDKSIKEKFLQEAYYRTVNQVSASHILIRVDQNSSSKDTVAAFKRISDIRKRILDGEPFAKVAKETSEDPSAQSNNGYLGWFSAFKMDYTFEDMAFKTPVGEISQPFRTKYGYHIVKNEGMRPSKGKVKVAHILFLAPKNDSAGIEIKERQVNECFDKLQNGESFSELARIFSDDKRSSENGGELGAWFSSDAFPADMEQCVFSLEEGEISKPFKTEYGWHLFKLMDKAPVEPYDSLKTELEKNLSRNPFNEKITEVFVEKLKKENNCIEYKENLNSLISLLDETIYEGKWDPVIAENLIDPVMSLNNTDYLQNEFARFISEQKRYNKNLTITEIVNKRFNDFTNEKVLRCENNLLEYKYPEFKNLMKEYHDGILLFNLTDDVVWSKAIKDTNGLKNFYEQNKHKYMWEERADISIYTFTDSILEKKVMASAKKRSKAGFSADKVNLIVCGNDSIKCVKVKDEKIEKQDSEKLKGTNWKKGAYSVNKKDGVTEIIYINKLLQPGIKKLEEAKGIITADYQTYLEDEWIKSLRTKYTISVNKDVLKKVK